MASTYASRLALRQRHLDTNHTFIAKLPKLELHIHIEGTMTPTLRFSLSQRHSLPLTVGSPKRVLTSLEETIEAYQNIRGRIGAASAVAQRSFTFFEAYYGGFELLREERDYYELALGYFERVGAMGVVYCEVFFDPQGHTRRGIPMDVMMGGFRRAQEDAERMWSVSSIHQFLFFFLENQLLIRHQVKSQWIMCFLRDMSPESAMEQYEAALRYHDMIVGVGLDSDELDRPPMMFQEVFLRAREDGFRLTSHCDFNQKDTHEHIRQVATSLGGSGADRIDHGLNAADDDELMRIIKEKGIGMTICPCAYSRHTPADEIFPRIRKLFEAGIKVTIASDDPAYMEDNWVLHNLLMLRDKCKFSDKEMVRLQENAIDICWASVEVKQELREKLAAFVETYKKTSQQI